MHPLSQLQQKDHYDRRTQVDRESQGQNYAAELLERTLSSGGTSRGTALSRDPSQPGPSGISHSITATDSDDEDMAAPGDLVAIVLPGSTPIQPLVELGKVLRVSADRTRLRYVPFQNVGGSTYRCEVGRVGRAAQADIVYPVGADYDEETKAYTLLADPMDIHNARHSDM